MKRKITWEEGKTKEVDSIDDLGILLVQIARDNTELPPIVEVEHPNGNSLSIGVGRDETVLSFVNKSKNPPYYASKGKEREGTIIFYYYGEWSEFPLSSTIPYSLGEEVIKEFFETGELSKKIEWQEV